MLPSRSSFCRFRDIFQDEEIYSRYARLYSRGLIRGKSSFFIACNPETPLTPRDIKETRAFFLAYLSASRVQREGGKRL